MSLFAQLLALSAGRPIFRASGHITLDGDDLVVSVHDANDDAHVLTQSNPAKRCAAPAGHADFANQLCLSFTGAQWYQSNRAASYWTYLHNSTGSDVYFSASFQASARNYNTMYATANGGGAHGITGYYKSNGVSRFAHYNLNPAAPGTINYSYDPSAVSQPPTDTAGLSTHRYGGGSYEHFWNSISVRSGTAANHSTSAPAFSLIVGTSNSETRSLSARWATLIAFDRVLPPSEIALVRQYHQQTYGIAA